MSDLARRGNSSHVLSSTLTELVLMLMFVILLVAVPRLNALERTAQELDETREEAENFGERNQRLEEENRFLEEEVVDRISPDNKEEFLRLLRRKSTGEAERRLLERQRDSLQTSLGEAEAGASTAENLYKKLLEQFGKDERELAEELAKAQEGIDGLNEQLSQILQKNEELEKSLAESRAQQRNLQQRYGRGGRDYPPCWPVTDPSSDRYGSPEYILETEIHDTGIVARAIWPPHRSEEAHRLPGIEQLLRGEMNLQQFRGATEPLLAWSNQHNCRHTVRVIDRTGPQSKIRYKRLLKAIEHPFYKYEPK